MNNQEAFDKVKEHLLEQKVRSGHLVEGEGFICLYRGPNGLKCAVGCLIPDKEYLGSFEGKCAVTITELVPALAGLDASLLDDLQNLHDNYSDWEEDLTSIAREYGLTS